MTTLSILLPLSGSLSARLPSARAVATRLDALLAPAFASGAPVAEIGIGAVVGEGGCAFDELQFFISLVNQERPGLIEMCARSVDGQVARGGDFVALLVRAARALNAPSADEALKAEVFIVIDVERIRAAADENCAERAGLLCGPEDDVECDRGVAVQPGPPQAAPTSAAPVDLVVIRRADAIESEQLHFWSTQHGWGSLIDATRFDRQELEVCGLPSEVGTEGRVLALLEAATQVIETFDPEVPDYARHYETFKLVHAPRIEALANELQPVKDSEHWRLVDGLKTMLGEAAANCASDDDDEQDRSITMAEDWVSQCCADGGFEEDVAMALYLYGDRAGETRLREQACMREVAR